MEIEIYIGFGYGAGSWGIESVNVPDILRGKDDLINDYIGVWMDDPARKFDDNVAFWGIYHIPLQTEDE